MWDPALIKMCTLHFHTASEGLGYTLHVHTAVGGKGYTLHVHTAGGGKEYIQHVHISCGGKVYTKLQRFLNLRYWSSGGET
jgi:hypothetical protein